MDKKEIENRIIEIETQMASGNFWLDKHKAQSLIKELQDLKNTLEGAGKYDRGGAVLTILTGAGGDDAEDFSRMLLEMYQKYCNKNNLSYKIVDENKNTQNGYRYVTIEISGTVNLNNTKIGAYGLLKNESRLHRLVRQ
ncbi:MAG: PCRF domain-containing protein, partial [Minisyncoccia bacterium]